MHQILLVEVNVEITAQEKHGKKSVFWFVKIKIKLRTYTQNTYKLLIDIYK